MEYPQKLSRVSPDYGQSPRGLINKGEAMRSLKKGALAGGLASAISVLALAVLSDFDAIYDGPFKEVLAGFVGLAVMYLRAKFMSEKFADQGDELR